ncbi:uncharacterized protein [Dermacentor andersoni]|uniref:uncharacterized protein n=1 Tax=Dermacentor andersoni TaxID=34620 RepID=UPI003B3A23C2
MCSVGAALAVANGRGNRNTVFEDEDYQVILPHLPTGRIVLNTVFLHADVRGRPYKVEDFRDALARLELLPEVVALGAYQMNHVWAVMRKTTEATRKLLAIRSLIVKERRCIVVDPTNQGGRMKLHWMLPNVSDDDIRQALAPYGTVTDAAKERWRVQGILDKGSTTRSVTLQLKAGTTVDDISHQLRIAGELVLAVIPGRAPLCLRCHTTGHIRRDCRVPRCEVCRRFGHERSQCVKTYAVVAGPARREEVSEHLMDEAEVEDISPVKRDNVGNAVAQKQSLHPKNLCPDKKTNDEADIRKKTKNSAPDNQSSVTEQRDASSKPPPATTCAEACATTDVDMSAATNMPAKRAHEETIGVTGTSGATTCSEPQTKAAQLRRTHFKPRPNVQVGRRPEAEPPP